MVQAAVLFEAGKPIEIHDVDVPATGPSQVRVAVTATGVCHSDLSLANGTLPYPVPCVLGHEGAGVVTDIGEDVTTLAVGDHVIIACIQPCHACYSCNHGQPELCDNAMGDVLGAPCLTLDGQPLVPMQGAGTFAEETLVLERAAVKIDPDIPLEVASLIGCAISTGAGAVLNTAKVAEGDAVAVIGCGGVGLSAVQGARMAGAERIIAIDMVPERRDWARKLGATDTLDPAEHENLPMTVMEMTAWRGVDHAIEVVGFGSTIRQAYDMTRRGGRITVVGAGKPHDTVEFNALELMFGAKTITGCVAGGVDPQRDFPILVEAWQDGRLDLESMITDRTDLTGIDDAFARMEAGEGIRTVVTL
ncbi:MAG: Zn-dependent alcohol dehydrogenase [Nitriliruptorales bacterium]|nr:Zn-dependent alcohol dehydrogenase [Nitriliruptorales bacterium]